MSPFGRQRASEIHHGALAGVVGNGFHTFRIAGQARDGGDVDHLAGVAGNHAALAHGLGEEEGGVHIQVHHLHPAFRRVVFRWRTPSGTGVVDQDVDIAKLADHLIHHGGNALQVGQVRSNRHHLNALGFQMRLGLIQLVLLAGADRNSGTQLAQGFGHLQAQATGAAGNESDFAGQVQ